nr:acyl-CoA dehydrogenase family protein [Streptomyces sp. SID4951]
MSAPAPDAADRTGQATTPEKSPAQPASPQVKPDTDDEIWRRVTREVADDLAVDALVRDRAGKPPFDELARLREAGLPALLTPPGPARRGTDWRTACAVIREISAADGSIGELLGRHYVLSWSARFFGTPERADGLERRASAEQWLWGGGIDLPDTEPATGPDLTLTPAEGGYLLNGCQSFAAGVTVADRLVLGAVPHDEHALAPFTTLAPLALRLALVHVSLGIAEGALAEARDLTRAAPRSRPVTGRDDGAYPDRPDADPYLLLAYGELVTDAHTAAAVVESASEALARGLLAGPELGVDQRAEIAVLVAAAEAVTSRSAMHLTTRILELTQGADSAADPLGFDRFWRNTRVLTAQASPTHGLRDIGDHYLNGTHPALTPHA